MTSESKFTPIPEPTERDPVHGDTYEHPSFGTIRCSRPQGGGRRPMFGSKILHENGRVVVEIHGASYRRHLYDDWIYEKSTDTIARVEMTEAQWARFISSPNSQAVPCTITARRGGDYVRVEDPPFFEIVDQFKVDLEEKLERTGRDAAAILAKIDSLLTRKTIPKVELAALRSKVMTVLEYLPGSLDFFRRQFGEAMETTVEEAKLEVESHIEQTLAHLGLDAAKFKLGITQYDAPELTEGSAE